MKEKAGSPLSQNPLKTLRDRLPLNDIIYIIMFDIIVKWNHFLRGGFKEDM